MSELRKKIEKRCADREKLASNIQEKIAELAKELKKLEEHDLETYKALTNPDCLFNDSPISPFKTYRYVKEWMMKQNMDFIGLFLPDGKTAIKSFVDQAKDTSKWILRFAKEKEKPKTGIDAIL